MNTCTCGRPAGPFYLCRACANDLARLLAQVPALVDELDVTLTRQDRVTVSSGGGGGRTEQPLPFNVNASDVRAALWGVLRFLTSVYGGTARSAPAASRFLASRVEEVRSDPEAARVLDEVRRVVEDATKAVDRHVVSLWFGVCGRLVEGRPGEAYPCPGDLYGPVDEALVSCPRCGAYQDAQARRSAVLTAALDRDLPAADLARLSAAYGLPVTSGKVRLLASRGKLNPSGTSADGRPVYRVGDLLDLLAGRTSS